MSENSEPGTCDFEKWLELRQPDNIEDKQFLISALESPGYYGRYNSSVAGNTMTVISRGLATRIAFSRIETSIERVRELDIENPDDLDQRYSSIMRDPTRAKGD